MGERAVGEIAPASLARALASGDRGIIGDGSSPARRRLGESAPGAGLRLSVAGRRPGRRPGAREAEPLETEEGRPKNGGGGWRHGLYRTCKRAGLREVGWHTLRHTFASHLAMRGVAIRAIQELMGHQTIAMTMRYAHLMPGATRAAVATLDQPAPDFGQQVGNSTAESA